MKNLILVGLFISSLAQASEVDAVSTRLCEQWRYDFQSSNYTCGWVGMTVRLVEAREHEAVVQQLEQRIERLEAKINDLENRK